MFIDPADEEDSCDCSSCTCPSWLVTVGSLIKRFLCSLPVWMVLALIATDWYLFNIKFSQQYVDDPYASAAVLHWVMMALFNIFIPLLTASYLRCVFTDTSVASVAQITLNGSLNTSMGAEMGTVVADASNGSPALRVCVKCAAPKPWRAHHCSICGKYVFALLSIWQA